MITIEIPSDKTLPVAWSLIQSDLDKFNWKSEIEDRSQLYPKLESGAYQLWVLFDDGDYVGFVITYSYSEHSEKKLAWQYLGGSKLHLWINKIIDIENHARLSGFVEFMAWTRPAIAKKLIDKFGYVRTQKTKQKWEVTKR